MPEVVHADGSANLPLQQTILLADDEERIRSLLRRLFERSGHRVLEAADGQEAHAFLANPEVVLHLLITDLSMPGMSGQDLLHEAQSLRPTLKIICLSAHVKDPRQSTGIEYMPKPFTLTGLAERVRVLLASTGA